MILISILAASPVLSWAIEHLHWPFIVWAAWKIAQLVTEVRSRATAVEIHVTKMATNCFPTMEASLTRQDALLSNIDKNIERLADKL